MVVAPKGHGILCTSTNGTTNANISISDTLIYNVGSSNTGAYDGICLREVENVLISDVFITDTSSPKNMRVGISTTSASVGVRIMGGKVDAGTVGQYDVVNGDVFIGQEITNGEYSVYTKTEDKGISVYGPARDRKSTRLNSSHT